MHSALDDLYDDLLRHVDENGHKGELTDAEKAKSFSEEKQIVNEKLREISLKRLEDESKRKEEERKRVLERKRQDAIVKCMDKETHEKETIRGIEESTVRFWTRDAKGDRKETGVSYVGESKRVGDAWVSHGHGEYRVDAEVVYEGAFCDGMMHGDGRLLFENGEIWEGQLWKDTVHGIGTLISEDDADRRKRRAIYWRGRKICFVDELKPGCRLQLLSDEFSREANGEGFIMAAVGTEGRYLVRLDRGTQKLIRLDCEHFRLLRHKPSVFTLDSIVGCSTAREQVQYDYDEDQANPRTTAYRENFFWPDPRVEREKAEQEQQAKLELEAKRSQILARIRVDQDAKKAAQDAACVARELEEDAQKKKQMARDDDAAVATAKDKWAAEAAKKQKRRDLSRYTLREG